MAQSVMNVDRIREQIEEFLIGDLDSSPNRFEIRVDGREVEIEGFVSTAEERRTLRRFLQDVLEIRLERFEVFLREEEGMTLQQDQAWSHDNSPDPEWNSRDLQGETLQPSRQF